MRGIAAITAQISLGGLSIGQFVLRRIGPHSTPRTPGHRISALDVPEKQEEWHAAALNADSTLTTSSIGVQGVPRRMRCQ